MKNKNAKFKTLGVFLYFAKKRRIKGYFAILLL